VSVYIGVRICFGVDNAADIGNIVLFIQAIEDGSIQQLSV
jgi:hypothetical protein